MPKADPHSDEAKKKRIRFGLLLFRAIQAFRLAAFAKLLLYGEAGDAQAFAAAYVEILIDLHTTAAFAGRGVAATFTGIDVTIGDIDIHHAVAVAHQQAEYVAGFRRDIEAGRYGRQDSGEFSPEKAMPRVNLYSNRANGTANDVMVRSLPKSESPDIWWVLGEADHCNDCPEWALNSPYTNDTLPATPGDGTSECKANCHCHLQYQGIDLTMFSRPAQERLILEITDPFETLRPELIEAIFSRRS